MKNWRHSMWIGAGFLAVGATGLATGLGLYLGGYSLVAASVSAGAGAVLAVLAPLMLGRDAGQRHLHEVPLSQREVYPGLRPFTGDDEELFFGREADITELVRRLGDDWGHPRRYVLSGGSGTGKSSFLGAGVVPRLTRSKLWRVIWLTTGPSPLASLSAVLSVTTELAEGSLRDVAEGAFRARQRVLLVIDQAERLISTPEETDVNAFLGMLGRLEDRPWSPSALFVVRGEFQSQLVEKLGPSDVRPFRALGPEQLAEVIEKPARVAGIEMEPGLAAQIALETASGAALPLLALVLRELESGVRSTGLPEHRITRDQYVSNGGVQRAIEHRAEGVVRDLVEAGVSESQVETALLKVAAVEAGLPATGLARPMRDFPEEELPIVRAFAESRLLIMDGDGVEATVTPAHDALLDYWPRLRLAIDGHRHELEFGSELQRRALAWVRLGAEDSDVLRAELLAKARRWVETPLATITPAVSRLISRSVEVEQEASELIAQRILSSTTLEPDHRLSLLVALAQERQATPSVLETLRRLMWMNNTNASPTVATYGENDCRLRMPVGAAHSASFSPDGQSIVVGSGHWVTEYEAAYPGWNVVSVWDSKTGQRRFERELKAVIYSQREDRTLFSPDGRWLLTGAGWVLNAETGDDRLRLPDAHRLRSGAFSPDGGRLLTVSDDGTARIWDVLTSAEVVRLEAQDIREATFPADGNSMVTRSPGRAQVRNALTGTEILQIRQPGISHAVLSPDGKKVLTSSAPAGGGRDGCVARVLGTKTGDEQLRIELADCDKANFSPDGRWIVGTGWSDRREPTTCLWDAETGASLWSMRDYWPVSFSADGSRFVTLGGGAAQLRDLLTSKVLVSVAPNGPMTGATISSDGNQLVTYGGPETLVWDAPLWRNVEIPGDLGSLGVRLPTHRERAEYGLD